MAPVTPEQLGDPRTLFPQELLREVAGRQDGRLGLQGTLPGVIATPFCPAHEPSSPSTGSRPSRLAPVHTLES